MRNPISIRALRTLFFLLILKGIPLFAQEKPHQIPLSQEENTFYTQYVREFPERRKIESSHAGVQLTPQNVSRLIEGRHFVEGQYVFILTSHGSLWLVPQMAAFLPKATQQAWDVQPNHSASSFFTTVSSQSLMHASETIYDEVLFEGRLSIYRDPNTKQLSLISISGFSKTLPGLIDAFFLGVRNVFEQTRDLIQVSQATKQIAIAHQDFFDFFSGAGLQIIHDLTAFVLKDHPQIQDLTHKMNDVAALLRKSYWHPNNHFGFHGGWFHLLEYLGLSTTFLRSLPTDFGDPEAQVVTLLSQYKLSRAERITLLGAETLDRVLSDQPRIRNYLIYAGLGREHLGSVLAYWFRDLFDPVILQSLDLHNPILKLDKLEQLEIAQFTQETLRAMARFLKKNRRLDAYLIDRKDPFMSSHNFAMWRSIIQYLSHYGLSPLLISALHKILTHHDLYKTELARIAKEVTLIHRISRIAAASPSKKKLQLFQSLLPICRNSESGL